jgi:hypothetical protein
MPPSLPQLRCGISRAGRTPPHSRHRCDARAGRSLIARDSESGHRRRPDHATGTGAAPMEERKVEEKPAEQVELASAAATGRGRAAAEGGEGREGRCSWN